MLVSIPVVSASVHSVAGVEPQTADGDAKATQQKSDLPAGALLRIGHEKVPMMLGADVLAMAFSPDGKWLAATAADNKDAAIHLWDLETGKEAAVLKGHKGLVGYLFFLPGGDAKGGPILVSGAADSTIRFWSVHKQAELPQIINHPGLVSALAVSPDGKTIASGSGKNIIFWDPATGNETRRWEAHTHGITCLTFGPEGKTLASGSPGQQIVGGTKQPITYDLDNSLALWDTANGKALHYYAGHPAAATHVALSEGGKIFIAECRGTTIFWDAATGKKLRQVVSNSPSQGLVLTPDGKTNVVADLNELKFIDIESGAAQRPMPHKVRQFRARISMAFSPDGATLAASGDEGRIVLWDVRRRAEKGSPGVLGIPGHAVAFSGDSKAIATAADDGVFLWDRSTGKLLRKLEVDESPTGTHFLTFLPDNRTLMLATRNQKQSVSLWDWTTGKKERSIPNNDILMGPICTSADGSLLASTAHSKNAIIITDVKGKELKRLPIPREAKASTVVSYLRLSPNGQQLLIRMLGSMQTHVFDVESGDLVFQQALSPYTPTFSPGGVLIAAAGNRAISLVDAASGKELGSIPIGTPKLTSGLHFSPDGRILSLVSHDDGAANRSKVELYDVASGKVLKSLSGHSDKIGPIAFSPDGKFLVSTSDDCTMLIWDVSGVLPAEKVDVKSSWQDLANADRRLAYGAYCRLRSAAEETIALLKTELKADAEVRDLEKLRVIWAIRLLEDLNTPAAREFLGTLADGTITSTAAVEARSALKRLQRSSGQSP
jgi:WD40 repeat protein